LSRLSIRGLTDLVGTSLGETNGIDTEKVTIRGLNISVSLNEGVPLTDKGAELISGEIEAVEVGEAVRTLDFFDAELELAESIIFSVGLEIAEGGFKDAVDEGVTGKTSTLRLSDDSLTDLADGEGRGSLDIVPVD
jgi:hypothetical protein